MTSFKIPPIFPDRREQIKNSIILIPENIYL